MTTEEVKRRVLISRNKLPERRSAEDWYYYNLYLDQVKNYLKKLKEDKKC